MMERINYRSSNVIKPVDKDSITSIKELLNQFKVFDILLARSICKQYFPRNKYNLP